MWVCGFWFFFLLDAARPDFVSGRALIGHRPATSFRRLCFVFWFVFFFGSFFLGPAAVPIPMSWSGFRPTSSLHWVLLGLTGFYWVLLGFTGFYWVLLGFTRYYLV